MRCNETLPDLENEDDPERWSMGDQHCALNLAVKLGVLHGGGFVLDRRV